VVEDETPPIPPRAPPPDTRQASFLGPPPVPGTSDLWVCGVPSQSELGTFYCIPMDLFLARARARAEHAHPSTEL
jgi:hypothetical protein